MKHYKQLNQEAIIFTNFWKFCLMLRYITENIYALKMSHAHKFQFFAESKQNTQLNLRQNLGLKAL